MDLREGCTRLITNKFKFKLLVILLVANIKPLLFKQSNTKKEETHKGL